ncbi:MAG TPA: tetratricopeptide repeat protein [Longimicrobiaceae bacterium]|nr:tetratricopeptide repeat protein [Longimicrobiaceae bacterium]
MLAEFDGDLGILLWQSLRNVMLWSATEPAKRKGLFSMGAEERRRVKLLSSDVDDSLRAPLAVIARLLADPAGADRRRVASACQRIGEWAEARNALATALAFTQAAALTASTDARLSYAVGLLARQRTEYARAETWFRRAILLGRQSGDWESYALAFVGLGKLYQQRGNLPSAQKAHLRAYRASRRKGLRNVQGMALHDLFVIAVERDQVRDAEEMAAAALKAYGPGHPRLPFFAHDVAFFWMERGYFAPAITVLTALLPHFQRPIDQALVLAHIARAAGGVHDMEQFEKSWQKAFAIVTSTEPAEKSAAVYLALAYGAGAVADWERTAAVAEKAAEIATAREEEKIKVSAEALLEAAQAKTSTPVLEEPVVESWMADHADALAANFARSLRVTAAR